jgi:hypothetical protein
MAPRPRRQQTRKPRRQKLRFIDPVLVSIPEFARISGLGVSKIRELVDDGTLPHRMIGNRVWIIREPAIEWLCKQVA